MYCFDIAAYEKTATTTIWKELCFFFLQVLLLGSKVLLKVNQSYWVNSALDILYFTDSVMNHSYRNGWWMKVKECKMEAEKHETWKGYGME